MAIAKQGFLTLRGGKLRGKKIPIPADGVRPTTDKMREQIFNLIDTHFRLKDGRARLPGARVLDAFAGTGALGMEALSRGAAEVYAWDTSQREVSALRNLGLKANYQSAIAPPAASAPMDLIFLDPPYGKGLIGKSAKALWLQGWLDEQTLIIAESEMGTEVPAGFELSVQKSTGQSQLWFLKLEADQNAF